MGVSCKNCGGTEIDHDQARGDAVCVSCGSVVESLCIVNEVEFQENSAGNASVIGQYVSAEGRLPISFVQKVLCTYLLPKLIFFHSLPRD